MTQPIVLDLFAGGGGVTTGAKFAGCEVPGAIEMDTDIAQVYADNHGQHITVARVQDVDPRAWLGIDFLWASPVCREFSIAKTDRQESEEDWTSAQAVCNFLTELQPKGFALENVPGYRRSRSLKLIRECLTKLGYWWTEDIVNAADYSVPQTRKRLILRALNGQMVPPMPAASRWISWYEAIEDLIPTLPPSQFSDWQLARLPEDVFTCLVESRNGRQERGDGLRPSTEPATTVCGTSYGAHAGKAFLLGVQGENGELFRVPQDAVPCVTANHPSGKYRAWLVDGDGNRSRTPTVLAETAPSITVQAWHGRRPVQMPRAFLVDCQNNGNVNETTGQRGLTLSPEGQPAYTIIGSASHRVGRAWLEQGEVRAMTPHALARFMSVPDTYILPKSNRLACQILGNMVCPLVAKVVMESLISGCG
jgi:DNA (cytosine-5)-methyltransferase 1